MTPCTFELGLASRAAAGAAAIALFAISLRVYIISPSKNMPSYQIVRIRPGNLWSALYSGRRIFARARRCLEVEHVCIRDAGRWVGVAQHAHLLSSAGRLRVAAVHVHIGDRVPGSAPVARH